MVKVYTTPACTRCPILKIKLKQKNIKYVESQDMEEMTARGIRAVPMMEVEGVLMDFGKSIGWVNGQ